MESKQREDQRSSGQGEKGRPARETTVHFLIFWGIEKEREEEDKDKEGTRERALSPDIR